MYTGRCCVYVRDDRPFGGSLACASDAHPHPRVAPPAAMFYYSRDRGGTHVEQHLLRGQGVLQADAYSGYKWQYEAD